MACPSTALGQAEPLLEHRLVDSQGGAWLATHHIDARSQRTDECALTYLLAPGDDPLGLQASRHGFALHSYNAHWRLVPRTRLHSATRSGHGSARSGGRADHSGLHTHLALPHTQGTLEISAGHYQSRFTLHAATPHLLVGTLTAGQTERLLNALEDHNTAWMTFSGSVDSGLETPDDRAKARNLDIREEEEDKEIITLPAARSGKRVMLALRPTHLHPAPSGEGTQEALEAFRKCINQAGLGDFAMTPHVKSPF
ncbi:hypothetical protein [Oecophyllibacter saccharovorans]|uniref:Uncharacterized protein n=1 Tax=Oecophyllibacter saccharovorans TaxID=2558360 RepID=A0A506UKN3_9PROT|nr:hypothetical protein [Oecophyllibacter saccharovorans]TPW33886.1 hypothetical protein E3202_04655 [Oecophyllibacter saccharovorans]